MNFFEHQDAARRHTGRLVVLFVLAVIAIVVCTYLVVAGVIVGYGVRHGARFDPARLADPGLLAAVGLGTITVVVLGSLYKIAQLSRGGVVVAESLGGRRLVPGSGDFVEHRLLNVVEEMAIASGTPVPPVYLMDRETGINAFAAGFSPADAVIGVTRGCAERLSREELQGVIAHEFSHILNGDMRLDLRLIGILNGILVIGILGYFLLRSSYWAGATSRRSSRDGGAMAAILAIGAGLTIVGFAGTFFGNWIKAAVSRQREYLADASAVQFTRDPSGIAGALKKIGGYARHATVDSPNATQASHMFFARAITSGINSLFATHPSLPERIRRIDPSWDGKFLASEPASPEQAGATPGAPFAEALRATRERRADATRRGAAEALPLVAAGALSLGAAIDRIGKPSPAHVAYARELLESVPPDVAAAAREPFGARAVVLGLLVAPAGPARVRQAERLRRFGDEGVVRELRRLLPAVASLDARLRLPLLETAMAALAAMSPPQYERFRANVIELSRADEKLDLFEWCLQKIVLGGLDVRFGLAPRPRVEYYALKRLGDECATLLSVLARAGARDEEQVERAFAAGAAHLVDAGPRPLSPEACGLDRLDDALGRLRATAPRLRESLIKASIGCVTADGVITTEEAEVLRAVAATLDCPMPPLLPGERLG